MADSVSYDDMRLLVTMSLGDAPSGEVNFKHLHTLLHEFINRLENQSPAATISGEKQEEGVGDKLTTDTNVVSSGKSRSLVGVIKDSEDLDHKLRQLESRMDSLQSIDEILAKVGGEDSTPVQDLMNYIALQSSITGIENGLKGNTSLLDQLMREFKDLKATQDQLRKDHDEFSQTSQQSLMALTNKFEAVAGLQSGAGAASFAAMSDLTSKLDAFEGQLSGLSTKLTTVESNLQTTVEELNNTTLPSKADIALLDGYITWEQMEEAFNDHRVARPSTPIPKGHPSPEALEALRVVGELAEDYEALKEKLNNLEEDLNNKVNTDEIANMMPNDTEQLMTTILEMQSKLSGLESDFANLLPRVPDNLEDQLNDLKLFLDANKIQLEALEGLPAVQEDWEKQLQEVASQLAQAKERLQEVDKSVALVNNALTEIQNKPAAELQQVDEEEISNMKQLIDDLHAQQHQIIENNQHIGDEMAINKEHIKGLYSQNETLKETKADKDILTVMEEKADRKQLETKASKQWVDNTFAQLDEEIRSARSKMQEQEEALKKAVESIGGEVENKLDKEEIGPLKDYFDEKLRNLPQTQPQEMIVDAADSAAGMRRPVRRFKCISCDRPVDAKIRSAYPSLPQASNLPSRQSFRPYATYELDLIRQHQKLSLGQGTYDVFDILPSLRACGGSHTVMSPYRRTRVGPIQDEDKQEIESEPYAVMYTGPSTKDELDLVGHDGHIYRGRQGKLPSMRKHKGKIPARPSTSPSTSRDSPLQGVTPASLKV